MDYVFCFCVPPLLSFKPLQNQHTSYWEPVVLLRNKIIVTNLHINFILFRNGETKILNSNLDF